MIITDTKGREHFINEASVKAIVKPGEVVIVHLDGAQTTYLELDDEQYTRLLNAVEAAADAEKESKRQ